MNGDIEEVFAWHAQPGAFRRLAPPWQPVRVSTEARSLRDGTATLALPAGMLWVAQHQPAGFRPPYSFVDTLTSWPLAPLLGWRHEHLFEPVGEHQTRVIDRLYSHIPNRVVAPMFAYRSRQLADDLAAHHWARALRATPATVAVTGSSGLIGSALCALLTTGGHRVIRLQRRRTDDPDARWWNPDDPDADLLADVDVVVHLAGEPIAGRFSPAHKKKIFDSRVGPTRKLALLAARTAESRGRTADPGLRFVCASAVGYYGPDRGDEILTEESERGDGFLADVVEQWEEATEPAAHVGVPVVRVRTGIVQTPAGGSLRLLRPLFGAGLGGRLGDGRQWTAWIGLDDLLDVYLRAIVDPELDGPVNAVSPQPVRNSDYAAILARVLHRPAFLPTPTVGPRLLLGDEGAHEIALAGQRVVPARLIGREHLFRFEYLEPALRHLLGKSHP
ncbi:MAG: TIGR01777 family oxidoreductase [Nakamurella sp.]